MPDFWIYVQDARTEQFVLAEQLGDSYDIVLERFEELQKKYSSNFVVRLVVQISAVAGRSK